jgi:ABC-type amino acid transport substrate-binding protein
MKAMLKGALVALGLAATMAMGLQAASAAEDSLLQKVLNRGTLRVGTTGDYPPYSA